MDGKGCVCIRKQMAAVSFAQSGRWDGASYTSADTKHQSQVSYLIFITRERLVMSLVKTSARVLFHVYLEGILGISSWKCHVTAHVTFPLVL